MLVLGLNIGKERYAINTLSVIEVVPLIALNKIPLADKCIKGIFNYRGSATPVIDLCQLFENRNCRQTLSTRIVLVNAQTHSNKTRAIGLVAEKVTDIIRCDDDKVSNSGISQQSNQYLGEIFHHNNEMIQLIETKTILPEYISQQLLEELD